MKVVLDCNVLIAAGLKDGVCREAIFEVVSKHTNYVSDEIFLEYKEVIQREKFIKFSGYLTTLLKIICESSKWLAPTNRINLRLPDQSDAMYLELALAAKAKYLITGNARHFPDRQYSGTSIISPAEFLKVTRASS